MILFRHVDSRYPFFWEDSAQPEGRWHGPGEGPVQYLADTPDGAWAEFLRHEGIRDAEDLATLRRSLWAVEIDPPPDLPSPQIAAADLIGGPPSYHACRREARRLRDARAPGLAAPSAALLPGGARGFRVQGGLREGPARDGRVVVLFGGHPQLVGWAAAAEGRPRPDILPRIRHL